VPHVTILIRTGISFGSILCFCMISMLQRLYLSSPKFIIFSLIFRYVQSPLLLQLAINLVGAEQNLLSS
jgi:hypothetical protein